MTRLGTLRWRLDVLRHARAGMRWLTAANRLLVGLLVLLLVVMLLDVFVLERFFRQLQAPRVVVMAASAAALGWVAWRYVLPLVRSSESVVEMALLMGHRLGMSSDLVAALQFDQPVAAAWGSTQLEQAVIVQAERRTSEVRPASEIPLQRAARSTVWLLLASVPWVAVALLAPEHVSVFFNRMALGSRHYPTRTLVRKLSVNDQDVLDSMPDASPAGIEQTLTAPTPTAHAADGEPVTFSVVCEGRLPRDGRLILHSPRTGRSRTMILRSTKTHELADSDGGSLAEYEVRLDRLLEPLTFHVKIGDAWTQPMRLAVIPKPLVELTWAAEPPSYARSVESQSLAEGNRNRVVLEGSRMALRVASVNNKRLKAAWLWVRRGAKRERIDLRPADTSTLHWVLPEEETPLSRVSHELRYELQVRDEDGLTLDTPVRGILRIRTDRPPFATASMVHRVVLPTASPVVEYRVLDDYGIAQAQLQIEIERRRNSIERRATEQEAARTNPAEPPGAPRGARTDNDTADNDSVPVEVATVPVLSDGLPVVGDRLPISGRYAINLSGYSLKKGDRLKISLRVTDYRGEIAGRSFMADPMFLTVTDERGVLGEISEADAAAEEKLTEIIKRQLGFEEAP